MDRSASTWKQLNEIENLIPELRRYARVLRHDPGQADDLVHSCLQRAVRALDHAQPPDLRTWLLATLRNSTVRGKASHPGASTNGEAPPPRGAGDGFEIAFRRLPCEQREALALSTIYALSPAQVGDIMGLDEEQVQAHVRQARDALLRLKRQPDSLAETEEAAAFAPPCAVEVVVVDDELLKAYVAGQLNDAEREAMEAFLNDHPEALLRVGTLRKRRSTSPAQA